LLINFYYFSTFSSFTGTNIMKKTLTLFLTACVVGSTAYNTAVAQTSKAPMVACGNKYSEEGDKLYAAGMYYQAYLAYEKNLKKASKDKDAKACITYQIARSFHKINDLKKAVQCYQKADKANYKNDETLNLTIGLALKSQGEYEAAKAEFTQHAKINPEDPRGDLGAKSCDNAVKWRDNPTCYTVTNLKALNNKADDYSPVFASKKSDVMIFTSSREGSTGKPDGIVGQLPEDLFTAKLDKKGTWSKATPLSSNINSKGSEGAAAINKKFNTLYFTRCALEKRKTMGCQIFQSKKQGNDWAAGEKIEISDDSLVTGHPAISADGNTMVFASNMPGGQGGMDLWLATFDRRKKTFANPVNLGPEINSPGNEMYPYLRADDKLYYSSDRIEGMGGLDIYKAELLQPNKWGKPENMRSPINSEGDDFAIVFDGINEKGMLTSSRKGGRGGDDIYQFEVSKSSINIVATVYDVDTKLPVSGAKVNFKPTNSDAKELVTDATGKANLTQANYNEMYNLVASKEKYFNGQGKASTQGIDPLYNCKDSTINVELFIKTSDVPLLYDVLFEYTKCNYYPEFTDTLDKIVKILKENPRMRVELSAHTDARGSNASNQKLSECRALEVLKYVESKGIEKERLTSKGEGEEKPRTLDKNIEGFTKGTVLTEDFINKLATEAEREKAHKLNRRVEMKKIDDGYIPKEAPPVKEEE
jgi:peptidoglycan-associated lipoprotein